MNASAPEQGFSSILGDNDAPPYAVDRTQGIGEHTVFISKVADVRKAQPRTVLGEHASEFIDLLAGDALGIIDGNHLGNGGFPHPLRGSSQARRKRMHRKCRT